eukprot:UN08343
MNVLYLALWIFWNVFAPSPSPRNAIQFWSFQV